MFPPSFFSGFVLLGVLVLLGGCFCAARVFLHGTRIAVLFAGYGYVTKQDEDGTSRSESLGAWLASVGGCAFSPQPLLHADGA